MPVPTFEATRDVVIAASRDQVWDLLADVGWWIGEGDHSDQEWRRGDLENDDRYADVLIDPVHGTIPIRTEEHQPCYLAYRCFGEAARPTTLVEFFVVQREGSPLVRVVESGYAEVEQQTVSHAAWEARLASLRDHAERGELWPWLQS